MDDFTKDELEIILEGILWRDNHVNPNERPWRLQEKIQSMIHNHCEHEWHPGGNRPWLHCIKCKSNFHHEPYTY